jgi:uncharacterized tellurite resistance protein B-like protein
MFDRIKNFLSTHEDKELGEHESGQRIQIATAVILLEVAYADEEFSNAERVQVIDILKEQFSLDDESVHELLQISEQKLQHSIDIWHFTEIINENYSDDEKYLVIETVWRVIYADGRLDKYEDYIVHKLARVLHIPHSRMIEAKMKFIQDE